MGSGASKTAAQSTIRKFPNRSPGSAASAAASRHAPSQRARPPQASYAKDEATRQDATDPHTSSPDTMIHPEYAQRLREIGIVQPNPTYSSSSTVSPSPPSSSSPPQQADNSGPIFPSPSSNLVLAALEARDRLQQEADEEFESLGLSNSQGRRFLTSGMIRDVLVMRDRGASEEEIENRFNLREGVVRKLGPKSLFQPVGGAAS
ncbi:hypothetical protein VP1G_04426 [Cytospora mali]|uniref:Helix-turn-helix domain-containing protein n=1 Tax=Cytospora mali TaxID=578113 RepID=A0A194UZJ7_CYTMA|nr:hypothetical protein VP1G_04426 [Valsa mali var. pyri (nom. inval.)]